MIVGASVVLIEDPDVLNGYVSTLLPALQELALDPDVELRNFIINSCTPPTPLMETVYNATMTRVPYEMACYICGPEQAMLLRTLVGLARPRRALDIGSFTGYASSAIVAPATHTSSSPQQV